MKKDLWVLNVEPWLGERPTANGKPMSEPEDSTEELAHEWHQLRCLIAAPKISLQFKASHS